MDQPDRTVESDAIGERTVQGSVESASPASLTGIIEEADELLQ
jgi:hypothetical protein